jgi:hypothetical protein
MNMEKEGKFPQTPRDENQIPINDR